MEIVEALLARVILFPATNDTLPVLALRLKPAAPPPMIVIVEALLWRVILSPATNDTLPVEALRVKAFPPPPTMVIVDALDWRVMFAPATKLTLEDDAFSEKLVAAGVDVPTIVTIGCGVTTLIVSTVGIMEE